jgi:alkanesulfonate monooxygenase SsuD/methylene tetrahydromethanopterin reductase-like flavin-dependent oxidoreductase (luciferase family)
MKRKDGHSATDPQGRQLRSPIERRALARGSCCVIGDPDAVARELGRLRSVGIDGVAINFVDYLAELPFFAAEVLPRLEELGIHAGRSRREPA